MSPRKGRVRRRGWVRAAGALLIGMVAGGTGLSAQEVARIGLVLPDSSEHPEAHASARRGAELGAEEAQRLVELLGGRLELLSESAAGPGAAAAAARRLAADQGVFALVGGLDAESCVALAEAAEAEGVLFFNIGCRADELRRERCWATTFHVAASEAMRRDALARHGDGDGALVPALWHPTLYRYGATQLNDRFRHRFDRPMDSHAWAAWLAVKTAADAALRARTTEAPALAAHLLAERTRLDGHKGRSLSFRSWDHQLRQPLYLLSPDGDSVVAEIPAGRPTLEQGTEAFLDQLGDGPDRVQCRREAAAPPRP